MVNCKVAMPQNNDGNRKTKGVQCTSVDDQSFINPKMITLRARIFQDIYSFLSAEF